ncbi:MAG: M20 family metallopeptidase [Deltaproteobacteria bacterium]|nr:M20 family metallopeptidase [Deltaproteobacteria bacterium]
MNDDILREIRRVLLDLPAVEKETFDDFLARANARLLAEHNPRLQNLLPGPAREHALWQPDHERQTLPVLIGLWVRSRGQNERIRMLQELIRHPTINQKGTKTPGTGPAFSALQKSLEDAAVRTGLELHDVEKIAFEIGKPWNANPPELSNMVGFLVHADVVPADEEGWTTNPFEPNLENGRISGRGSLDDKGPLVAVFSALDGVIHNGLPFLKKAPVLIIGTSEETHWAGIERFQEVRGTPGMTVVTDANFPVGVGEKGVASVRIEAKGSHKRSKQDEQNVVKKAKLKLIHIQGGQVSNQVPASATAEFLVPVNVDADALFNHLQNRIAVRAKDWETFSATLTRKDATKDEGQEPQKVYFHLATMGVAAHSADPHLGRNALTDLTAFIAREMDTQSSPCIKVLRAIDKKLGRDFAGKGLGLDDKHPRFSPSTINLGTIRPLEQGGCKITLNLRWPPPRSAKEVVDVVGKNFSELDADISVTGGGLDPFLQSDDTALVLALQKAYSIVTGKPADPVTVSGTTYAKAVKGAVTFGPEPSGDHHSRMHAPNEYITVDELNDLAEMYANAMMALCM